MKDGMPAVGGKPKVAGPKVEVAGARIRSRLRVANPQHGRQRLRRPEDGLFVERLLWVSCEKRAPSGFEIRRSLHQVSRDFEWRDIRFGSRHCAEDIPRQSRENRPLAVFRKLRTHANQTQTL
jgi:hypothetical protein